MSELLNKYSEIILNSFLCIKEGDALSINTEESDFEFAKIIADMAVKNTKTVVKIVLTDNGKPTEVIDFDPYDIPVPQTGFCMLHLQHKNDEKAVDNSEFLDVIVDKDDMKAIQKLGHLADPIILDRRITIPWCVVPSYNVNSNNLSRLVESLSNDIDGQILSAKYRVKYLNHADIESFHFFCESCDFTVKVPKGCMFYGGPVSLNNGRVFISGTEFQNITINVDKNSLNGWFIADTIVLGKDYKVRYEYEDGKLISYDGCEKLTRLLDFDTCIANPGSVCFSDKYFSINFGCASVDSLSPIPDSEDSLPIWFNNSLYKYSCVLDQKLNIEFFDSNNQKHELFRKGFFIE